MKKILSIAIALVLVASMSVVAFAANVETYGHIGVSGEPTIEPEGDPDNPDTNYDLTFSATVHWYVTQTSYPNVINGDANGPDDAVSNKIVNNSAANVEVKFVSFAGSDEDNNDVAATVAPNLTLNLTGNLAIPSNPDLSSGYTEGHTYRDELEADSTWTYGFTGEYTAANVNASYAPQYTMVLGFSFSTSS